MSCRVRMYVVDNTENRVWRVGLPAEWLRPQAALGDSAMFGVGPTELFIVCLVALLLFGSRLPSVMRSLGKGISEFKRGMDEITKHIES
jgi:sec-independent protein translocase protein TatA